MSTPRRFSQEPYSGPPGSTELYLVRHGASADAIEGEDFELIDGHGNPPLSDIGREQAELVGARLAHLQFDVLYVTTLRRTVETAAPLIRRTGLDPGRRTRSARGEPGRVGRRSVPAEDGGRRPDGGAHDEEERWDVVPGAESPEVFGRRIRSAVERIAAAHPDARVVAFSHGAAIGEVLAQATGSRPFAFLMSDNTAIARLVLTPDSWVLRGFNDTAHLHPWAT